MFTAEQLQALITAEGGGAAAAVTHARQAVMSREWRGETGTGGDQASGELYGPH